jgi:hypothetical protein
LLNRTRCGLVLPMSQTNNHSRAKKGGEYGANGEWYEGGKFINTVPENAKRHGSKKVKPVGKRNTAPGVWEIQPTPESIAIFPQLSGIEIFNRETGLFTFNPALRLDFATETAIARRQDLIARYNQGERWV